MIPNQCIGNRVDSTFDRKIISFWLTEKLSALAVHADHIRNINLSKQTLKLALVINTLMWNLCFEIMQGTYLNVHSRPYPSPVSENNQTLVDSR